MSKLLKIIICLCLLLMCSGCNINEKHNNSSTTKMEESSITSENTEDISSIENTLKMLMISRRI